ncbi:hypothetical protein J3E68DRAFT_409845 [Trichoderma sp. SZMC 28012]
MSHTTWLWLADLALSAIDGAAASVLSSALIKMTPSPVWKLDYAGNAAARRGGSVFVRATGSLSVRSAYRVSRRPREDGRLVKRAEPFGFGGMS